MTDTSDGMGVTVDASFGMKLHAALDTLAQRVKRQTDVAEHAVRVAEQAGALLPIPTRVKSSGIVPAGGQLVLDLGGPAQGRKWEVRGVIAGGASPSAVTLGAVYLYGVAMPLASIPSGVTTGDAEDFTTTLPAVSFYGAGEFVVLAQERLYAVFVGATVAARYEVGVQVNDLLVSPADRPTVLS